MKKLIPIAIIAFLSTLSSFAQSNSKGTIHIGVYAGGVVGISASKATPDNNSIKEGWELNGNAKTHLGVRASFGIVKRFSVGAYARKETSTYFFSDYNGAAIGLEGKYYPINKEKFNLYVGPTIGYSTGDITDRRSGLHYSAGVTGYNYSIGAGINWYWTKYFGMSADIGYAATALHGHIDQKIDLYGDSKADTFDMKIKSYGIYIAVGIVTKFGGNK